jgi:type I restriction enzyme M protein
MTAVKKTPPTATSPQAKLAAVIKSARDYMRKDAGLNGDLDRIPQLAWLLFLKAFDGLEESREVTDEKFRPAIEAPYRWRDWAADPNGRTGEALLTFVNGELLPYLRGLSGTGTHDPRDTLAAVFKETYNRMLSGYLLRDVVNKVNEINFASSDDIHTMAHLYESMLREMRDAAGDSGEFYTPRPIIRFMVQQVDPKLGEVVLDPAEGTGGFLVESLEHQMPMVTTTSQLRTLHSNLRGIEKKPLPFLLGMMNLVLHGVGQPNVVRGNALAESITQIGKARRVDVVLTNPPFGGEEEKSIQANFPADKQTSETAWLFLQLVIRMLKDGGRCGIVVPNGLLFGGGVGSRIKKQLLTECNLHTIVRLPDGAFAPYTDIPTNLLFFDKTDRTKEVWYYQIPPPEGRKKYSKTKPMHFEEFADCQAWWTDRTENERAWRVPIADLEARDYNLDLQNPNRADDLAHRPPAELLTELIETERQILGLLEELQAQTSVDSR